MLQKVNNPNNNKGETLKFQTKYKFQQNKLHIPWNVL